MCVGVHVCIGHVNVTLTLASLQQGWHLEGHELVLLNSACPSGCRPDPTLGPGQTKPSRNGADAVMLCSSHLYKLSKTASPAFSHSRGCTTPSFAQAHSSVARSTGLKMGSCTAAVSARLWYSRSNASTRCTALASSSLP